MLGFSFSLPMRKELPAPSPVATPAIHLSPLREFERNGHYVVMPAGSCKPAGHLLHFHGLGGLGEPEIRYVHDLAAGKYRSAPIAVAMPLAQKLAPRGNPVRNMRHLLELKRFVGQQPLQVQTMLKTCLENKHGLFAQAKGMASIVRNPPWWHPFLFKFATHSSWLEPDQDATIRLMYKTAQQVAPYSDEVLASIGAVAGEICASGFSMGVGQAIMATAILRPEKFCHLVLVCASHIKTDMTLVPPDKRITVDVILPKGDPVLMVTGFTGCKLQEDLAADFASRARVKTPPGSHAMSGAVARLAGLSIVSAMRARRHAEPIPTYH